MLHFEKQGKRGINFTFHLNLKRKRGARLSVGENWFIVPDFYGLGSLDDCVQHSYFLQRSQANEDSDMHRNGVPGYALSVV